MGNEKEIKRYEPYGFLLALGMFCMLGVMLYALYKFRQNLKAGVLLPPEPGPLVYAGLGILLLVPVFLWMSAVFSRRQQFPAFRTFLSGSFAAGVIFIVLQVASVPARRVSPDPFLQGDYYLAFLGGIHLLFVLAGVVATGVWLARVYRRKAYVESFIFSVNPPNILTMKLLVRYMFFVAALWAAVIFFLRSHAA